MTTREQLIKGRLPEREVDVEGVGTIRIRGLSRAEALALRDLGSIDRIERRMIALGMVDPPMTEDDVRAWADAASAGELEDVSEAIAKLSGMDRDADRAAMSTFRDESDGRE